MDKDDKDIDAILWLTARMPMNKTFNLDNKQQEIIKFIFCLSGIGLPVKKTKGYDYYFDIADDWTTIKKVSI